MSYPVCRSCGFMVENTRATCRFCGQDPAAPAAAPSEVGVLAATPPPSTVPGAARAQVRDDDGWLGHFGRYIGVGFLVGLSSVFFVGVLWSMFILSRTGYRKRDVLLFLVPIVGIYVSVVAMWRYTAKTTYWSQRLDRPSWPLNRSRSPFVVAAGYLAAPVYVWFVFSNMSTIWNRTMWTETDRVILSVELQRQGLDPVTSDCVTGRIERQYPLGPPDPADPVTPMAIRQAVNVCTAEVATPD